MSDWEYKRTGDIDEDSMNDYGVAGWELVAVCCTERDRPKMFWKRPMSPILKARLKHERQQETKLGRREQARY